MPDETTWLAKGACAECGRPIAMRASGTEPVDVTCNVCRAVTRISPPAAPKPRASRRWSWPVVVAVIGGFFVAGVAVSLFLGAGDAPDAETPFVPPDEPQPTPTGEGPITPTPDRPPGEFVRVYVNDTTNATHDVTIQMWQGEAQRASERVNTSASEAGTPGEPIELDPEASAFELRVYGEAEGVFLVRAFEAPRCGTSQFDVELVIGDDSRFRWGRVGCGAVGGA